MMLWTFEWENPYHFGGIIVRAKTEKDARAIARERIYCPGGNFKVGRLIKMEDSEKSGHDLKGVAFVYGRSKAFYSDYESVIHPRGLGEPS